MKKLEYAIDTAGYGDISTGISQLRSSIGKVKKVVIKWLALLDVKDVFTGMMKEYDDIEIASTIVKEIASNFEKEENGNLTFVLEKSAGDPATIYGGKGNDKIYGNDLGFASYVYEYKAGDGKDTIFNWNANDTLSISGDSYTGKIVNNDYIVYVGKGSVTFKNYTRRRRAKNYEDIPCRIEGKQADDTIENGGANVSINAGDGNDSADKFIYKYGDGNDFIFGFDSGDTLTLDGLDFKTSYKNGDVTFKVNGGSVTLKDFTATTFHVNDETYQVSGSKLVKKS